MHIKVNTFVESGLMDSWEFSVRRKQELDTYDWLYQGPEKFADKSLAATTF